MKIVGIIPARYQSSRFPGKPLANILGIPMIVRVCDIAAQALGKSNIYVATDSPEIQKVVEKRGYQAIMTSSSHPTGTDRLAEAVLSIESDIYINIQGDEPMLDPNDIVKAAEAKKQHPDKIINGFSYLSDNEDPDSINIPKIITNTDNELVYASRAAIPCTSKTQKEVKYKKQVCIYAFSKEELLSFAQQKTKTPLESVEDIEILRFLEMGHKILMVETNGNTIAVDTPEDLKKVEHELSIRTV